MQLFIILFAGDNIFIIVGKFYQPRCHVDRSPPAQSEGDGIAGPGIQNQFFPLVLDIELGVKSAFYYVGDDNFLQGASQVFTEGF